MAFWRREGGGININQDIRLHNWSIEEHYGVAKQGLHLLSKYETAKSLLVVEPNIIEGLLTSMLD